MKQLPTAPDLPAASAATRRSWLKRLGAALGGGLLARAAAASPAHVQTTSDGQAYIGEIVMFGFEFAPRGYALCNGQLLAISQNTALFSILGTKYGGDGRTTFGLPNLQGYTPIHNAQQYPVVTNNGESVTLTTDQLPAHSHTVPVSDGAATSPNPANQVRAVANGLNVNGEAVAVLPYTTSSPTAQAAPVALAATGDGQPVTLQSPYLVINFCIALTGIFPARA